jgi:hypothetical protein
MVRTGNAQYDTPWRNPVDASGLSKCYAGEVLSLLRRTTPPADHNIYLPNYVGQVAPRGSQAVVSGSDPNQSEFLTKTALVAALTPCAGGSLVVRGGTREHGGNQRSTGSRGECRLPGLGTPAAALPDPGADPPVRLFQFGWSALHWAVNGGHGAAAKTLLHIGADPNVTDQV